MVSKERRKTKKKGKDQINSSKCILKVFVYFTKVLVKKGIKCKILERLASLKGFDVCIFLFLYFFLFFF